MNPCRHIDVCLALTPEQVLHYYHGAADTVLARSLDGRSVRFPANVLPRLVTKAGIHGIFRLEFDTENRLQEIRALSRAEDL